MVDVWKTPDDTGESIVVSPYLRHRLRTLEEASADRERRRRRFARRGRDQDGGTADSSP